MRISVHVRIVLWIAVNAIDDTIVANGTTVRDDVSIEDTINAIISDSAVITNGTITGSLGTSDITSVGDTNLGAAAVVVVVTTGPAATAILAEAASGPVATAVVTSGPLGLLIAGASVRDGAGNISGNIAIAIDTRIPVAVTDVADDSIDTTISIDSMATATSNITSVATTTLGVALESVADGDFEIGKTTLGAVAIATVVATGGAAASFGPGGCFVPVPTLAADAAGWASAQVAAFGLGPLGLAFLGTRIDGPDVVLGVPVLARLPPWPVLGANASGPAVTYDCWKPILHEFGGPPSRGRVLNDVLADHRVVRHTLDVLSPVAATDLQRSLGTVENIWHEVFAIELVRLPDGTMATHAARVD